MPDAIVIKQIRSQKNGGYGDGRDHESFMHFSLAGANRRIAPREEHRAESVQRSVQGCVGKHRLCRSSPRQAGQCGILSYIIKPSSRGMCRMVACMTHLARAFVLLLAAHRHTCTSAVLVTSAPKKYRTPAIPKIAGSRLTPTSAAA